MRWVIFAVCAVGAAALVASNWQWLNDNSNSLEGAAAIVGIVGALVVAGKFLFQQTEPEGPLPPLVPSVLPESPARAFERRYRAQYADRFANFDAKGLSLTLVGPGRPAEGVKLDDIFLEPRLGEGYDLDKLDVGTRIRPAEIARRATHLVVKGPAGAGKTTWMQWLFRELLRERRVLPIFIELRRLAFDWSRREAGRDRSLDETIERWAAEFECEGLREYLKGPDALRPVLLVDGWDELGDLAHDMRAKLRGFLRTHRDALAIVTSRPYGEARPEHSREGDDLDWEVLDIQPLSDEEIKVLALNYNRVCFRDEERKPEQRTDQFLRGLESSHGADRLARTPLLLTMLLAIGRTRELPDRRHELYERTIDALLERPISKEKEGARFENFRPDTLSERRRVAASLAYELQARSRSWRGPILADWGELRDLLPWKENKDKCDGFLAWLSGPAALLEERLDGRLAFGHLSFQEFLAAWDRSRKLATAKERIALLNERQDTEQWRETLRLWAALLHDEHGSEALEPILHRCFETSNGLALAGAMLADGLGSSEQLEAWGAAFAGMLRRHYWYAADYAASAWKNSRQAEKRTKLPELFEKATKEARWDEWLRLDTWRKQADAEAISTPSAGGLGERIVYCLQHGPRDGLDVGAARILCGADPAWPGEPWTVALLQAWPGRRRTAAVQAQTVVAFCGANALAVSAPDLLVLMKGLPKEREVWSGTWAQQWIRRRVRKGARGSNGGVRNRWTQDLAEALARDLAQRWIDADATGDAKMAISPIRVTKLVRSSVTAFPRRAKLIPIHSNRSFWVWMRGWVRINPRVWTRTWAQRLTREQVLKCGLDPNSRGALEFGKWETLCLGRAAARALLANLKHRQDEPAVRLMAAACQLSLRPKCNPAEFEASLAAYKALLDPDPLWPALARHLARRREEGDWELLEDLARHPEKREPPLSWGLRFIVRGDLVMDDGSVVELDTLSRQHGLEPLPYLEELPDEIDLS